MNGGDKKGKDSIATEKRSVLVEDDGEMVAVYFGPHRGGEEIVRLSVSEAVMLAQRLMAAINFAANERMRRVVDKLVNVGGK